MFVWVFEFCPKYYLRFSSPRHTSSKSRSRLSPTKSSSSASTSTAASSSPAKSRYKSKNIQGGSSGRGQHFVDIYQWYGVYSAVELLTWCQQTVFRDQTDHPDPVELFYMSVIRQWIVQKVINRHYVDNLLFISARSPSLTRPIRRDIDSSSTGRSPPPRPRSSEYLGKGEKVRTKKLTGWALWPSRVMVALNFSPIL